MCVYWSHNGLPCRACKLARQTRWSVSSDHALQGGLRLGTSQGAVEAQGGEPITPSRMLGLRSSAMDKSGSTTHFRGVTAIIVTEDT